MLIYIRDVNVLLDPGEYDYTVVYENYGQIGFFDEYDELYWNVTGNTSVFAIAKAPRRPGGSSRNQMPAMRSRHFAVAQRIERQMRLLRNAAYHARSDSKTLLATQLSATFQGDRQAGWKEFCKLAQQ